MLYINSKYESDTKFFDLVVKTKDSVLYSADDVPPKKVDDGKLDITVPKQKHVLKETTSTKNKPKLKLKNDK